MGSNIERTLIGFVAAGALLIAVLCSPFVWLYDRIRDRIAEWRVNRQIARYRREQNRSQDV